MSLCSGGGNSLGVPRRQNHASASGGGAGGGPWPVAACSLDCIVFGVVE